MDTRTNARRDTAVTCEHPSQNFSLASWGYLGAALASLAAFAALPAAGLGAWALFARQCAPAFLMMGICDQLYRQCAPRTPRPPLVDYLVHSA